MTIAARHYTLLLLSAFCALGCNPSNRYVTARLHPYNRKHLASYQIGTPDPLKATMLPSEILSIHWKTPRQPVDPNLSDPVYLLRIQLRFKDGSEKQERLLISSQGRGRDEYLLDQSEYSERGGIVSYKISLLENGAEIASTEHKLWHDPIVITE